MLRRERCHGQFWGVWLGICGGGRGGTSVSIESRLCSRVVPVRGCPSMKTGGGSRVARQLRKASHSTVPTIELKHEMQHRKTSLPSQRRCKVRTASELIHPS